MQHWHSKSLGDEMWADIPSEEIKRLFQPLFESAGRPAEMAVFTRHEEGSLHCEWVAYFSPSAAEVAKAIEANSCNKPAREGLNLLAGSDEFWSILFAQILERMRLQNFSVVVCFKPKEKNMSENNPINGVDVSELLEFKNICAQHPEKADRNPTLVAHWEGGSRSRVEFKGMTVHLGGDGEFNPMQMFLATLAACDVDLIAMHASFLGLEIESLSVEATGHFNVRSYLGLDGAPGSGYDGISYTVRISVPGATPEQIASLRERCERSSPVGDSMSRAIPLTLEFAANEK